MQGLMVIEAATNADADAAEVALANHSVFGYPADLVIRQGRYLVVLTDSVRELRTEVLDNNSYNTLASEEQDATGAELLDNSDRLLGYARGLLAP